jgi:hypothetical protein
LIGFSISGIAIELLTDWKENLMVPAVRTMVDFFLKQVRHDLLSTIVPTLTRNTAPELIYSRSTAIERRVPKKQIVGEVRWEHVSLN